MAHKVNGDVFGLSVEIFVNEQGKSIDLKYIVGFFWFIQNHCQ